MLFGPSTSRAVLLAAEVIKGDEARRLGVINRPGSLPEALAWAESIAALAPLTIAGHKLMLNALEEVPAPDAEVAAAFSRAWESEDFAEGLDAFRHRRTPRFRGR
jgi:enoyl-CoA hydratase